MPDDADQIAGDAAAARPGSCSTRPRDRSSTCSPASTTRSRSSSTATRRRDGARAALQPRAGEHRRTAGRSSTTRAFTSSHGDSSARAATSSATSTASPGTSAIPTTTMLNNPGPFTVGAAAASRSPTSTRMKGPMTTQSLRGMANHGPMHWRGDRTGGNERARRSPTAARSTRTRRSRSSTSRSPGCSAASAQLTPTEMQAVHRLHPAGHLSAEPDPQPRQLAHADQQPGRQLLLRPVSPTSVFELQRLPHARSGRQRGFGVGRAGLLRHRRSLSFEIETQLFKVPHLRNMYQKVGMFGMPRDRRS